MSVVMIRDTFEKAGHGKILLSLSFRSNTDRFFITVSVYHALRYKGVTKNKFLDFSKKFGITIKSASFVVQAIAFKQTGNDIKHRKDLLGFVSSDEQAIAEALMNLNNGGRIDFDLMSGILFDWTKKWISKDN